MTALDILGWVAASFGMASAFPQLYRLLRTRSSAGVSLPLFQLNAAATGAFAPWVTPKAWTTYKPTKVRIAIARGYDYCFQVRATNRAGQVGPWSPTRCTASALDDSAATSTSAGWRRSSSALLYAGTGMRTTTHGAWWKMTGVALARIGVVGQMADISDVDDMGKLVALVGQHPAKRVGKDIRAHIADMRVIIDRWPAGIDTCFTHMHGDEGFELPRKAVEEA